MIPIYVGIFSVVYNTLAAVCYLQIDDLQSSDYQFDIFCKHLHLWSFHLLFMKFCTPAQKPYQAMEETGKAIDCQSQAEWGYF